MALPELYRFGREGKWFGLRLFLIYMIEGIYQVCLLCCRYNDVAHSLTQSTVIYFIVQYAYFSPTARSDGYGVGLYEFSTVRPVLLIEIFTS
jgi:phospholipid-translocating ATPase